MEEQATYAVEKRLDVGNEKQVMDIVRYQEGRLEMAIKPTWEQAQYAVTHLDKIGRNVNWWLGDLLNHLEDVFGEEWAQLIPDIGWEEKTLMNFKWVAKAVHPDVRELQLPWGTHAIIAKLDPESQAMWLERALTGGWTGRQLAKEMKGPPKEPEPKHRKLKICCPECECNFQIEVEV